MLEFIYVPFPHPLVQGGGGQQVPVEAGQRDSNSRAAISRRMYTYSLRHQYSLVYLHTTRATISTKTTPQLRTIMSAYKLRR